MVSTKSLKTHLRALYAKRYHFAAVVGWFVVIKLLCLTVVINYYGRFENKCKMNVTSDESPASAICLACRIICNNGDSAAIIQPSGDEALFYSWTQHYCDTSKTLSGDTDDVMRKLVGSVREEDLTQAAFLRYSDAWHYVNSYFLFEDVGYYRKLAPNRFMAIGLGRTECMLVGEFLIEN